MLVRDIKFNTRQKMLFCAALCVLQLGAPTAAYAQDVLPVGRGWADLPRPEYDALGIPVGSFQFYPQVEGRAEYNSNALASQTNAQDDFIFAVRPEFSLESTWSRNFLALSGFLDSSFYADLTGENHTDYGADAQGIVELGSRTTVGATLSYQRQNEDRTNIDTAITTLSPVQFDALIARLRVLHVFNNLRVGVNASWSQRDYDDSILAGDVVFDQDFRDRDVITVEGVARYEFSPGYSMFVSTRYTDSNNDIDPGANSNFLLRDFTEWDFNAGIAAEVSDLLYATLGVGYFRSEFDDVLADSASGLSLRGSLLWNITGLTSLRGSVSRNTDTTANQLSSIRIDTAFGVGVDHELLYNLILSADAAYRIRDFQGFEDNTTEFEVGFGANYLLNNYASAGFQYSYERRDSLVQLAGFKQHRAMFFINFTL